MSINTSLLWFRRDLRAFDHAALHHALRQSQAVHCVFIYDTAILATLPRRDRRVDFIHASVAELAAELRSLGGDLIVLHADAAEAIPRLAAELQVDAVFANHDYEPQAIARDATVAAALTRDARLWFSFKDQVIFEKDEVLTLSAKPYTVYTPYKKAWLKKMRADPGCLAPFDVEPHAARLAPPRTGKPAPLPTLGELGFEASNLAELAIPTGMSGASKLFDDFLPRAARYDVARDYPALKGPSYLSMHLRFGTVSLRYLVRTIVDLMQRGGGGDGAPVWLAELIWRDFYHQILFHHPHVVGHAYKREYDLIKWAHGKHADAQFAAWCEGRTGYPLVDAAMRQLNQTGYMHNRLRMVTASFLIKDLGIDWRRGEAYFAEKLLDFDLAANNGGWQWAASSGCDAQPYFRIFNPISQSEKFDPQGKFIRRYVPELASLPDKALHAPWLARPADLATADDVVIGRDYPQPIVQHDEARAETLGRYAVVKANKA